MHCSNPGCSTEFEQVKPWQRFCQTKCKRRLRTLEKRDAEYKAEYMVEYSKGPRFRYNVQKQAAKALLARTLSNIQDCYSASILLLLNLRFLT